MRTTIVSCLLALAACTSTVDEDPSMLGVGGKADGEGPKEIELYSRSNMRTVFFPEGDRSLQSYTFRIYGDASVGISLESESDIGSVDAGWPAQIDLYRVGESGLERVGGTAMATLPVRTSESGLFPDALLRLDLTEGTYRIDMTARIRPMRDDDIWRTGYASLHVLCDDVDCIPPTGCAFGHLPERFHAGEVGTFSEEQSYTAEDIAGETSIARVQLEGALRARGHSDETWQQTFERARSPLTRKRLELTDGRLYDVVSWDTEDRPEIVIFELGTARVVGDTAGRDIASTEVRVPGTLEASAAARAEVERVIRALAQARGVDATVDRVLAISGIGASFPRLLGYTIWRAETQDDSYLVHTADAPEDQPYGSTTPATDHHFAIGAQVQSRARNVAPIRATSAEPPTDACRDAAVDAVRTLEATLGQTRIDDAAITALEPGDGSAVFVRVPITRGYRLDAPVFSLPERDAYVVHLEVDGERCDVIGLEAEFLGSALSPGR